MDTQYNRNALAADEFDARHAHAAACGARMELLLAARRVGRGGYSIGVDTTHNSPDL